jgi:hypothetical protein
MATYRIGLIGAAALLSAGLTLGGWPAAEAQLTRVRPAEAPSGRPVWHGDMEGWQVGVWGAPGAHRWRIDGQGRGMITLGGPPRIGGRRSIQSRFALTVPEHVRFAGLIERFTDGVQNADLCMTDQAQDIIQWGGGARADGLFNFDHGCRDAANMARLALLTEALGILREADARERG